MRIPKYESRYKAGELLAEFIKRENKDNSVEYLLK